jgi:hypothetical protein
MRLQNIFEELETGYLCNNAYEFSAEFLGKSKGYYSVLKSRNLSPSISTLAVLEMALLNKANEFSNDEFPIFTVRRNKLLSLVDSVKEMRQQRCIAKLKGNDSEDVL